MFLTGITQTSTGTTLLPLHWLMEANNKTVFLVSLSSWRAEAAACSNDRLHKLAATPTTATLSLTDIFKRTPSAMCRSCERLHHLQTRDEGVDTHISLYQAPQTGAAH